MNNKDYMEMLFAADNNDIVITWNNGLKVKCSSFTGICETDTEPGDDDYIGEYSVIVYKVQILEEGRDDSVLIYNNGIEICLLNIPELITKEDGTVLWKRKEAENS